MIDLETDCTFAPMHWSAIERLASPATDPAAARAALAEFCQSYWLPLYAFIRARGYSMHDALDLTQARAMCEPDEFFDWIRK
ncbi:MAG: hypothetical protein M3R59_06385 [Verrucomicrobiota bacterium]|nr:hypothetical protein [Verrucomicrobiota bacterium]